MSTNQAFVFIKPHANTTKVQEVVKSGLESKGIKILAEGEIKGSVIDSDKLIDQHYYAIASKATILKPDQLNIPEDKFKEKFGEEWKDVLASGKALNAMDAGKKLGLDAAQLDAVWAKAKKADQLVKFGGGFYCGKIEMEGQEPLYSFNGFFMQMRSKFVGDCSIHYYVVEFNSSDLKWADFRGKVLGPTDPADAPADSLRGLVLANWEEYGLTSVPNVGDNGVHASASPFEGLAERNNWVKAVIADDDFGKKMINAGISEETIKKWSVDPQVKYNADGKMGSLFDAVEDMDCDECLAKLVELNKLQ
jgi:nucleoside diphosphate kinase